MCTDESSKVQPYTVFDLSYNMFYLKQVSTLSYYLNSSKVYVFHLKIINTEILINDRLYG
jgi:hypothetical protein